MSNPDHNAFAAAICRCVAELGNSNSPEAMRFTSEELHFVVLRHLEKASAPTEAAAMAATVPAKLYVEVRECSGCNHVGVNDSHQTLAACNHCEWSGPSPKEDQCPECNSKGTMVLACPECGGVYRLLCDDNLTISQAPVADQPAEPSQAVLHLLWLALEQPIMRYLMSNAHGRWDGAEKAHRHEELCRYYVAAYRGTSTDRARRDGLNDTYNAVHRATQALTDHMDEVIGFPLEGRPDYDTLAPKFFAEFHRLAVGVLAAPKGDSNG